VWLDETFYRRSEGTAKKNLFCRNYSDLAVSAFFNGFYLLSGIPHSLSGSEREQVCSYSAQSSSAAFSQDSPVEQRFSLSETFLDFSM
jgi:hypothetical protein